MAMMRGSLASLPRMSMDALNTREDADRALRIWLLSAVTREGGATYYRLAGRFQANGQTWEVLRRYSEFLTLRSKLIKFLESADDDGEACPGCVNYLHAVKRFEFPKKHIFSSRNPAVVNYRVKALRSFMNLLASWAFSTAPKCPLCGGHAFELVRNFVIDGAEPVTGSDMDYIRGSISVDAFTSNAERPSAFARPSLDRRHSWIPASGSATLRAQQQQQGWNPSKSANNAARPSAARDEPDAYDTFNDYLPARPSQRVKGSNTDAGPSNGKFGVQRADSAQQNVTLANAHKPEGFLLYGDGASFGTASMDTAAAPRGSTTAAATNSSSSKPPVSNSANGGLKGAMRKHKSEPRNVASREDSDSFVSFSSTVAATSIMGVQPHAAANRHSNMLSSPNMQPNMQPNGAYFDSFVSDTIVSFSVEPVSSEYAEQRRLSPSDDDDEHKHDDNDDDDEEEEEEMLDDEIDITGVALASPPATAQPSAKSGENLWQPWELARNG